MPTPHALPLISSAIRTSGTTLSKRYHGRRRESRPPTLALQAVSRANGRESQGEFVHPSYDIGQVSPTPSEEEELAARGEWEDAIPDMLSVLDSLAKRQRSIQDQSQELVVALHKAAYALGAKSAMHKLGLAQVDDARPDQTVDLSAPSAVQALRGLVDLYCDVAAAPVVDECREQHPGVEAWTRGSLRMGDDARSAELVFRTKVAITGSSAPDTLLSADCLAALASKALLGVGKRLYEDQAQNLHDKCFSGHQLQVHDSICHALREGEILSAERRDPVSPYGHAVWLLHIQDPKSPRVLKALFKPRVHGDSDGWHRVNVEWVAYELALLLGMDCVPPVALRKGVHVSDDEKTEGALLYFAENAQVLKDVNEDKWGVRKDVLLSNTRILDVLLQNSDRHHGHFLYGEHWSRGNWEPSGQWKGDYMPFLIDHAAGFRHEALVLMQHDNAFMTGAVQVVSAETYLRLRFLNDKSVERFRGVLSEAEIACLLNRRDGILAYLDRLVEERGYSNVVV